jgi:cell division protein YceG involved in septum cleavage
MLDFGGDLGGIMEIIFFLMSGILYPIAEFSFKLKALQKLYLARTTSPEILLQPKSKKRKSVRTPDGFKNTEIEKEIQQHHQIKLSSINSFRLYLSRFYCRKKEGVNLKLSQLYETGTERLEKEMSLEKIIKNLRDLKTLTEKQLLDEDLRF